MAFEIKLKRRRSADRQAQELTKAAALPSRLFSEITMSAALCASVAAALFTLMIWIRQISPDYSGAFIILACYPMLWLLLAPAAISLRSGKRLGFTLLAPFIIAGVSLIGACAFTFFEKAPTLSVCLFSMTFFGAAGGSQGYLIAVKGRSMRLGIFIGAAAGLFFGLAAAGLIRIWDELTFMNKGETDLLPTATPIFIALVFLAWLTPWLALEIDRITHRLNYGAGLLPRNRRPILPEIPRLTLAAERKKKAPFPFRRRDRHELDIAWRLAWLQATKSTPVMVIALSGEMRPPQIGEFWDMIVEAIADGWRYFVISGARIPEFILSKDANLALSSLEEVNGRIAVCETQGPPALEPDVDPALVHRVIGYKDAERSLTAIREEIAAKKTGKQKADNTEEPPKPEPALQAPKHPSAVSLISLDAATQDFFKPHHIGKATFLAGVGGWSTRAMQSDSGICFALVQPFGIIDDSIFPAWVDMLADMGRNGWRVFVFDCKKLKRASKPLLPDRFLRTLVSFNGKAVVSTLANDIQVVSPTCDIEVPAFDSKEATLGFINSLKDALIETPLDAETETESPETTIVSVDTPSAVVESETVSEIIELPDSMVSVPSEKPTAVSQERHAPETAASFPGSVALMSGGLLNVESIDIKGSAAGGSEPERFARLTINGAFNTEAAAGIFIIARQLVEARCPRLCVDVQTMLTIDCDIGSAIREVAEILTSAGGHCVILGPLSQSLRKVFSDFNETIQSAGVSYRESMGEALDVLRVAPAESQSKLAETQVNSERNVE